MGRPGWHRSRTVGPQGRQATRAQIIEAIDRSAPDTKDRLAAELGISEQYLSELLQELKRENVVRKAYVVDDDAVYENARSISRLATDTEGAEAAVTDAPGGEALGLLSELDEVTRSQYDAARTAFAGDEPDQPATALESLANDRHGTVLSELKSFTLTTDWPGNRVAADLATVATNLEIVGDRACYIADAVAEREVGATGIVEERVCDIFEAGQAINDCFAAVAFDCDLDAYEDLLGLEETVHRDLDELFELVTAYDPTMYGHLVTVTRALERAIYYWVHSAEIAVRLHAGLQPDHAMI